MGRPLLTCINTVDEYMRHTVGRQGMEGGEWECRNRESWICFSNRCENQGRERYIKQYYPPNFYVHLRHDCGM